MNAFARVIRMVVLVAVAWPQAGAGAGLTEHHELIRGFFPAADRIGQLEGEPPAAPVFGAGRLLGYVFFTDQVVAIPAYSGKPIHTLVGCDLEGRIRGLRIISHQEPILKAGVSEEELAAFVAQYRGIAATDRIKVGGSDRPGYVTVDAISGATITMMVLNASIVRSLQEIARSRGLVPGEEGAAARAASAASAEPLWITVWRDRVVQIVIIGIALLALTLILLFQDWLAQRPRLLFYVRDGYLLFTLFFVGWYTLAQLSVINVFVFLRSMTGDFRWDTFLIEPLFFILWGFVAMTLLLWGRGVYCGWLCPFGALQELINQAARRFKVRQWEFPAVVHERLWALKYLILLGLFGVSLQSLPAAERLAEIEPFKTAITLRFQREWAYLAWALGLLAVSIVNRKFYCKYLCPLGAALAIPARLRLFDWLRRRKECGRPCQICAEDCEVRAIKQTGEINANECHYCLDCQVTYWNSYRCPPLVERRKRRERASRLGSE